MLDLKRNKISSFPCTDIDECEEQTADCALNATCSDTDAGYTCTCKTGFEGDGKKCKGIKMIMYWLMVTNIAFLSLSIHVVLLIVQSIMTQLILLFLVY